MEMPWNCSACSHENMIDMENLTELTVNKLVDAQGFFCENCGSWEAVSYTSMSLKEAEKKLKRYTPEHRQFRFLFNKLARKVSGMVERMNST